MLPFDTWAAVTCANAGLEEARRGPETPGGGSAILGDDEPRAIPVRPDRRGL